MKLKFPKSQSSAYGRGAFLDMAFCVLAALLWSFWVFEALGFDPSSFHSWNLSIFIGFASAFFISTALVAFAFFATARVIFRDKMKTWPPGGLFVFGYRITFGAAQCIPVGLRRPPRTFF